MIVEGGGRGRGGSGVRHAVFEEFKILQVDVP